MKHKKKQQTILIGLLIFTMLFFCIHYLTSYQPAANVTSYFSDTEELSVTKIKEGWFFDGPGENSALIFYPGAKVDAKAYAPLLYQLAQNGVDCFLVDMPFHMAFFGINRADDILNHYSYDSWYLGGHSLGGAMISTFAAKHYTEVDGLFLLASYTTKDLSHSGLSVLTIYGSNDGVLNRKNLEKQMDLLPAHHTEICIKGGNHAQFGSYGHQKGDGTALLSRKEQISQTVDAFFDFFF